LDLANKPAEGVNQDLELFYDGKICATVAFLRMGYVKSKREERYMERRMRPASCGATAPTREGSRELETLGENAFQPSEQDRTGEKYGRRG